MPADAGIQGDAGLDSGIRRNDGFHDEREHSGPERLRHQLPSLGMKGQPAVYILASRRNGALYTGVTSELVKRVWEHKHDVVDGFTRRYGVHVLVWYELHETMESAIGREKAIKN
jgi:putative endonuclease